MTTESRILIRGGLVVDAEAGTAHPRDILVTGDRISEVAAPGSIVAPDATLLDAADRLVIPGLVNAHTHGHMSLQKGIAERWTLEASLTNGAWLAGPRDPETIYASTLLAAGEMLLKGATTCFDLVYEYPHPTVEGFFAVAQAYADAGMHAVLAPMISDTSLFRAIPGLLDALPPELGRQVDGDLDGRRTLEAVNAIVAERSRLPEGISLAIAPTIPHHCSMGFLLECADIADRHDLPIHMHIAESRLQALTAQKRYGRSPVSFLKDLGILRKGFVAAHAVWLDENDLDTLAETGCGVAHIPASNMRLGVGVAHIRPMLERGITVGLATDGANSSDSLDMMRAMRLANYIGRTYAGPREGWLGAAETIRLGTIGGATLAGRPEAGRIAPGAAADLVFLDLGHIDFLPLNDPLNQVVNCAGAATITDVMASGKIAVRDRKLVSAVFAGLPERVRQARARLEADSAGLRALSSRLEPHVVAFAQSLAGEPLSVERYLKPAGGSVHG